MYVRASADDGYPYGGEPGATHAHRATTSVTEEAQVKLIADRYDQDPAALPDSVLVLNPARDIRSGGLVSILRVPAPVDAAAAARELNRLQRFAHVRHPHLAELVAVDPDSDMLCVVCEPLEGRLPTDRQCTPLTVRSVQRIATDLLDALRALHQGGVVHGAVGERSLLVSRRAGATDPDVLLLPVPLLPDPGKAPASTSPPVPPQPPANPSPEEDIAAAAALLLAVLHRVPKVGMEEAVLSARLARFLEGASAGGLPDGDSGSAERDHGTTEGPVTRRRHGAGGRHRRARRHGQLTRGSRPHARNPAGGMPRHRWRLTGLAAAIVTAVAVATLVVLTVEDDEGTRSASTAATPTAGALSSTSSAPRSPSAPPETIPGLMADLTARPDVAGPAGPLLLNGLQGLRSSDEAVRQRAALQVLELLIGGQGLDPRYATASRLAVFRTLTGLAPAPQPGESSCLALVEGLPPPVEQEYSRQILDRLPSWQTEGFPAEESARLRELVTPVAVGQAHLVLRPCPTG
jgi:hypothetical protein